MATNSKRFSEGSLVIIVPPETPDIQFALLETLAGQSTEETDEMIGLALMQLAIFHHKTVN